MHDVLPAPTWRTRHERRIVATDDEARRAFTRYWLVVRPGSDLVRVAWLRAAQRRALTA